MATLAASFAGCGVGKSGSPAPKSTTSTPCRFSFAASPATFIVGDVDTLLIRSASMNFPSLFFFQPAFDNFGHQAADLTAKREDFFDEPRTDVGVLLGRHHEDRLDMRAQAAVHQRHLKFRFKIRERAQP